MKLTKKEKAELLETLAAGIRAENVDRLACLFADKRAQPSKEAIRDYILAVAECLEGEAQELRL